MLFFLPAAFLLPFLLLFLFVIPFPTSSELLLDVLLAVIWTDVLKKNLKLGLGLHLGTTARCYQSLPRWWCRVLWTMDSFKSACYFIFFPPKKTQNPTTLIFLWKKQTSLALAAWFSHLGHEMVFINHIPASHLQGPAQYFPCSKAKCSALFCLQSVSCIPRALLS